MGWRSVPGPRKACATTTAACKTTPIAARTYIVHKECAATRGSISVVALALRAQQQHAGRPPRAVRNKHHLFKIQQPPAAPRRAPAAIDGTARSCWRGTRWFPTPRLRIDLRAVPCCRGSPTNRARCILAGQPAAAALSRGRLPLEVDVRRVLQTELLGVRELCGSCLGWPWRSRTADSTSTPHQR